MGSMPFWKFLNDDSLGEPMDPHTPDAAKASERRQHRRFPVTFSITVESESTGQNLSGALLDVSDGGLRLFLPQGIPVGTPVRVRLETPVAAFAWPGRIVWAAERRRQSNLHGVILDREQGRPFAERLAEIARQAW
jgi:hypothetical protein